MSQEPAAAQKGDDAPPNMFAALFGGVAIGFLLGTLVGPAVMRRSEQYTGHQRAPGSSGSSGFSGPLGAEGGGFDGEPLYEPE